MRVRSLLAASALTVGTLATPAWAGPALAQPHPPATPAYQTAVPGESVEADRVDQPWRRGSSVRHSTRSAAPAGPASTS